MTCPELRITDEEARSARVYRTARGEVDGRPFVDEWGPVYGLPRGASARIGRVLLAAIMRPARRRRPGMVAMTSAAERSLL